MHTLSRRTVVGGLALAGLASTDGFSQQAIRIVFPFGAGGAADALLRLIAQQLQSQLVTAVVVENRTGASGQIGAVAVKDAVPDGKTLLFAAGAQMVLQPHYQPNLPYEPFKDFAPVSQAFSFEQALVVGAEVPVQSILELVSWFRQNPDKATFGTPGVGTAAHFTGVLFARMADLEIRHTPYRGTPAALPDLIAGRLPLYIASAAEMFEQHRVGRLRILATAAAQRLPNAPDIPTLRESGFDILAPGWFAFYAPARIAPDALRKIERAVIEVLRSPEIKARITAAGFQPLGTMARELEAVQRAEFQQWASIVKSSGYRREP